MKFSPNSKALREYKASLGPLSKIQSEVLTGVILGDSSIQTQNKGKTYRVKFEWGQLIKITLSRLYFIPGVELN